MLRLAVRKVAPFDDPDQRAVWFGDSAAVWYWSRGRVAEAVGGLEAHSGFVDWIPEALLIGGTPDIDGAELLANRGGVTGRAWRGGMLIADRWWPHPPSLPEWQTFARGAGLAAPPSVATPVSANTLDEPWTTSSTATRRWSPKFSAGFLERVWIVLGTIALLVVGFESGASFRALTELSSIRSARAELEEPLRQILEARESAERRLAETEEIVALLPKTNQTALIAEFANRMPSSGWTLTQWQLEGSGQMAIGLAMPTSNLEAVVASLEESPLFVGVRSSVRGSGDELTLEFGTGTTAEPSE